MRDTEKSISDRSIVLLCYFIQVDDAGNFDRDVITNNIAEVPDDDVRSECEKHNDDCLNGGKFTIIFQHQV